jgi:hypothetical protein
MAQDYVHPLQALRAVLVQRRRKLAESLLGSRKGAKAARRRRKLIKLQREIDVIDDAIADEQLLSPSIREQLAWERTLDKPTAADDEVAEGIERVKTRLTELSERLAEPEGTTIPKQGAR